MLQKLLILLQDIRKCPAVYLGKKSLERLDHFIGGYVFATCRDDPETLRFFRRFQRFVEDFHNIHSAHSWADIIDFYSNTEEEAFDDFYRLLDLFLQQSRADGRCRTIRVKVKKRTGRKTGT